MLFSLFSMCHEVTSSGFVWPELEYWTQYIVEDLPRPFVLCRILAVSKLQYKLG